MAASLERQTWLAGREDVGLAVGVWWLRDADISPEDKSMPVIGGEDMSSAHAGRGNAMAI